MQEEDSCIRLITGLSERNRKNRKSKLCRKVFFTMEISHRAFEASALLTVLSKLLINYEKKGK